jgi:hypothetical protein
MNIKEIENLLPDFTKVGIDIAIWKSVLKELSWSAFVCVTVVVIEHLGPLGEMKSVPVEEMATRCNGIDGCVDFMDGIGGLDAGIKSVWNKWR